MKKEKDGTLDEIANIYAITKVSYASGDDQTFLNNVREAFAKQDPFGAYISGMENHDKALVDLAKEAYFVALLKNKGLRTMAYNTIILRISDAIKNVFS